MNQSLSSWLDAGRQFVGSMGCRSVCRLEYRLQRFTHVSERLMEYRFVFQALQSTWPRTVLDVGTGTTALPSILRTCGFEVTAIDNIDKYWPRGMFNRHYHVIQDDIVDTRLRKEFDFITCISVLEHSPDYLAAVRSMFGILREGGHLVLTFPYNETTYIEDVYVLPGSGYGRDYSFGCQVFSREQIDQLMSENTATIVEQEYWRVFTGDYWTFGERLETAQQVDRDAPHHMTCILCRKEARDAG